MKTIFIIYLSVCMHVQCTLICRCPQRPEEDVGTPGAAVTVNSEIHKRKTSSTIFEPI